LCPSENNVRIYWEVNWARANALEEEPAATLPIFGGGKGREDSMPWAENGIAKSFFPRKWKVFLNEERKRGTGPCPLQKKTNNNRRRRPEGKGKGKRSPAATPLLLSRKQDFSYSEKGKRERTRTWRRSNAVVSMSRKGDRAGSRR